MLLFILALALSLLMPISAPKGPELVVRAIGALDPRTWGPDAPAYRTPWLLHAPLDGCPQATTIALSESFFIAYETATCGLYMAWQGELELTDTRGTPAIGLGASSVRRDNVAEGVGGSPWEFTRDEEPVRAEVSFIGCEIDRGVVGLVYRVHLDGGVSFRIVETPRLVTDPDDLCEIFGVPSGTLGDELTESLFALERIFEFRSVPEWVDIHLRWNRRVDTVTWWPGFDGATDRGPRAEASIVEFDVEPILLTVLKNEDSRIGELVELK